MGYIWPAPRRDPLETSEALALATALTILGAFAVSIPLEHIYDSARAAPVAVTARPEAITFVIPAPPRVPAMEPPVPELAAVRTPLSVAPPADALRDVQRAGAAASAAERPDDAVRHADTARMARADASLPPTVGGPVLAPLAFSPPAGPRVMRLLPGKSTLNGWRLVPRDEQDGFVSDERKRYEEARELKPADVAARGGGLGFTTGWLGRGPSREQRARDKVIHEANLLRLAGLAARAQAKLDSARIADSLATLSARTPPAM